MRRLRFPATSDPVVLRVSLRVWPPANMPAASNPANPDTALATAQTAVLQARAAQSRARCLRRASGKLSRLARRAKRSLVRSYLSGDRAALNKQLTGKNSAVAGVLLLDLAKRDLPSQSLGPYLYAQAAMSRLNSASLTPLVADSEHHLERIRELKRRYFDGKNDGNAQTFSFRRGVDTLQEPWSLWIALDESPKDSVSVTLSRSAHPSWKSKPPLPPFPTQYEPATKSELSMWPHIYRASEKAHATKDGYVWLVRHRLHGGSKVVEDTAATLGQTIAVPANAFACEDSAKSLTQKQCTTILEFSARFLLPGHYDLDISYRGQDGVVHTNRVGSWFRDIYLGESMPSGGAGTRQLYHRFAELTGPGAAGLRKAVRASLVGKRRFKVAAMAYANTYWRGHSEPTPDDGFERLQSIFLDIDYKLQGGTAPQTDEQETAYRNRLLKKGYEIQGDPRGHQYIPLPDLSNKPHTICLIAKLSNGAVSPQANCHTLTQ